MGARKRKATQLDAQEDLLSLTDNVQYTRYSNASGVPGSSSNPIVLDSSPAPAQKRQRRVAGPQEPGSAAPEKRAAMTKKKFFMVDRKREEGELHEEFQVLGSTGNASKTKYPVAIVRVLPVRCGTGLTVVSGPDALKGNHCKHILFIYTKVLQVPYTSHVWYQKALLTSELEEIFSDAPLAPNDLAHVHVREAYERATGKAVASAAKSSGPKRRIPEPDTDCPVCYEGMHGIKEAQLAFCESCGNCLHKQCFDEWARTKGRDITSLSGTRALITTDHVAANISMATSVIGDLPRAGGQPHLPLMQSNTVLGMELLRLTMKDVSRKLKLKGRMKGCGLVKHKMKATRDRIFTDTRASSSESGKLVDLPPLCPLEVPLCDQEAVTLSQPAMLNNVVPCIPSASCLIDRSRLHEGTKPITVVVVLTQNDMSISGEDMLPHCRTLKVT
ncbi:hypothetical protein NM688_g4399 [Phlebia brevispora]|uniref:Uncharacterized protein n=1 Tax=Phlebia brevispora TaxID=194682 RepID=A0ACC1T2R8_9APHY|nr:hypothetical protein NM688_g4399 [Phlebia brevispora]